MDSILTAGKRHIESQQYREAAVLYLNTSHKLSLNEAEHIEDLCLNGIDAVKFIDDQYLTRMLHLRLAESYLFTAQESKVLELEKKILFLDIELLTRDFYGAAAFYQQELLTQHGKDKRARELEEEHQRITNEILAIKSASLLVNLPQGEFYTESYDQDGAKEQKSINISENQIEVLSEDSNGNASQKLYQVDRCFYVDSIASILSVAELRGDEKYWNFIILIFDNQALTLNHSIRWDNNETKQDSLLYVLLQDEFNESLSEKLLPGFEEYYRQDRFTQLTQLPTIGEEDIDDIRTTFLTDFQHPDDPNNRWYKDFLLGTENFVGQNNDLKKRALKNVLIEKGFHPFLSTSFYISSERTKLVNSREFQGEAQIISSIFLLAYLLNTAWFLITIKAIAIFGFLWIVFNAAYHFYQKKRVVSDSANSQDKNESAPSVTQRIALMILGALGTVSVIILGCYLGSTGGWSLGHLLGYTGGASIVSVFFAIIGIPIGGVGGFALGIYLVKIKVNTIRSIET